MYIVLIEGYNWKEKNIIALKTKSDIHFKTILFDWNDTYFETDGI